MRWWVVVALLLVGCKSKRGLESAPEQDALWKLAPLTATRGIVITSEGLVGLESAWREMNALFDQVPELAAVSESIRTAMPLVFAGRDVSLAKAGMNAKGGAALFYSKNGELFILPVVDRSAFLAFTGGTAGSESDVVRDLTCKPIGAHYACAKPAGLLGRIGEGTLREQLERVGRRGELEIAFDEGDTRAGVVATFERGGVVMRGAVRDPRAQHVVNAGAQAFDTTKLAGFGVFNAAPLFALLAAPREPLAGGATLADFVAAIPGPMLLSLGPGIAQGEVRVPFKDSKLAQTLVTKCEDIAYLAILSSRFRDGACHLRLPNWPVDVAITAENGALRARLESPPTPPVALRPSRLANEIAGGTWALSMYGRGTPLGLEDVGTDMPVESVLGLRLLGLVHEGGIGVRREGNVLRFVLGLRTVWSNPDELVKKWFRIPAEQLVGRAGLDAARAMAATVPSAPLVDDLQAGTAVMFPITVISFVAGLASPELFGKDTMRELSGNASAAEAITAMASFTDAMCECKDTACAQRVSNEMDAWSTAQAASGAPPPELSDRDKVKVTAIGERLGACMKAAMAPSNAVAFIAKHIEFRNRVCTCTDLTCAEDVNREMTAWADAYMKKLPAGATMSKDEETQMAEIEGVMRDCMIALRAKK